MPPDVTTHLSPASPAAVPVPGLVTLDLHPFLRELAASVEATAARRSRLHHRLAAAGLVLGLCASVLAAAVAVFGPVLLESVRAGGAKNPSLAWQVPCFVVAVLGAASTFLAAFQERFRSAEGAAAARECLGKVRALQVAQRYRAETEILREIEELAASHPDALDPALLARLPAAR